MFDFAAISHMGETLESGVRDLDTRMGSISNRLMMVSILLICDVYGIEPNRIMEPRNMRTIMDALDHVAQFMTAEELTK